MQLSYEISYVVRPKRSKAMTDSEVKIPGPPPLPAEAIAAIATEDRPTNPDTSSPPPWWQDSFMASVVEKVGRAAEDMREARKEQNEFFERQVDAIETAGRNYDLLRHEFGKFGKRLDSVEEEQIDMRRELSKLRSNVDFALVRIRKLEEALEKSAIPSKKI